MENGVQREKCAHVVDVLQRERVISKLFSVQLPTCDAEITRKTLQQTSRG